MTLHEAVANLIKVRGRHNTEVAYQKLIETFDAPANNAWHGLTDPEIHGLVRMYRDDPFTLVMEAADMLMERNIS